MFNDQSTYKEIVKFFVKLVEELKFFLSPESLSTLDNSDKLYILHKTIDRNHELVVNLLNRIEDIEHYVFGIQHITVKDTTKTTNY